MTNPRLLSDPLWTALDAVISRLQSNPWSLRGMKHEWDRGLNSTEINARALAAKLADRPVFEPGENSIRINHPSIDVPVTLVTNVKGVGDVGTVLEAHTVKLAIAYLEGWMALREWQLVKEKRRKGRQV